MSDFIIVGRNDGEHYTSVTTSRLYKTAKLALTAIRKNSSGWKWAVLEVNFGRDKSMEMVPESAIDQASYEAGKAIDVKQIEDWRTYVKNEKASDIASGHWDSGLQQLGNSELQEYYLETIAKIDADIAALDAASYANLCYK